MKERIIPNLDVYPLSKYVRTMYFIHIGYYNTKHASTRIHSWIRVYMHAFATTKYRNVCCYCQPFTELFYTFSFMLPHKREYFVIVGWVFFLFNQSLKSFPRSVFHISTHSLTCYEKKQYFVICHQFLSHWNVWSASITLQY